MRRRAARGLRRRYGRSAGAETVETLVRRLDATATALVERVDALEDDANVNLKANAGELRALKKQIEKLETRRVALIERLDGAVATLDGLDLEGAAASIEEALSLL